MLSKRSQTILLKIIFSLFSLSDFQSSASSLPIHYSVLSNLLLNLIVCFLFSYCILHLVGFFCMFSNSFLKFSLYSSILLSLLSILMIINLNSLMGKLFTSTSLILLGFYLKHTPPLPHFSQVFVFISMYYVGLLCFSVLEKWLYVENVLWAQQHIPFWLHKLCALQVPPM